MLPLSMNAARMLRTAAIGGLVVVTLVPRLASLGHIVTIDEPLWRARSAQFVTGLATGHLSQTFTNIHPGVTTAWIAGATYHLGSLRAGQAAIALAVSVGLFATTYLLMRLTTFWIGLAGGAALALDPFYIAHSRVVHTDALLATSLLLALLLLMLYRQTGARRYLVAGGVVGGLIALTKIQGLLLLPFAALLLFRRRRGVRRWLREAGIWGGLLVLTFALLWPALWAPTPRNIRLFVEQVKISAAENRARGGEDRWWYYAREFSFRLTPAVTLLGSVGALAAAASVVRRRTAGGAVSPSGESSLDRLLRAVVLPVGLFSLAYVVGLSPASTKSDRWILIAFLAADLAAVAGALWIGQRVARHLARFGLNEGLACAACVVLLLGASAREIWRLHPYALAHYNRLFPIYENRKLGWGEGLEQVAVFLNSRPDAGVPVVSYYPRVLGHFYRGQVERLVRAGEPGYRHVVLYRSMLERSPDSYESDFLRRYLGKEKPLHVVTINGLPYAWVFENIQNR